MEDVKILVVDDDIMNLKIAEIILKKKFEVSCVKSGAEMFGYLKNELPTMILLDVHMPEMGGFEIIRILKEDDRTKDIPVIFLTADNDREAEIKGFKEGALDYITKPFVADVVLQRITRILQLDNLQKNLEKEVEK